MKFDKKKDLIGLATAWAAFIIFTLVVWKVDVQAIGPQNSKVGLAGLNSGLQAYGYHEEWYKLSEVFGRIALAVAGGFALLGAWQLVKDRSLKAVDKGVWLMGGFYCLVVFYYVFFDKAVVNSRPVISDEGLEPSYPSSHTMLAICVLFTAAHQFHYRLKKWPRLCLGAIIICWVVMAETVICRLLSGVHWLTDIIGGVLLSTALISLYFFVEKHFLEKKE